MNNPDNLPIDPTEMREWLLARKSRSGLSWSQIATEAGMKSGTLSPFASGVYAGNLDNVARQIFRYRQQLESQADRRQGLIEAPGYFETPTARRLKHLMVYAHMGRMTLGATGPGTGKTMAAREYAASVSNCFLATMSVSDASLTAMCAKILRALGVEVRSGYKDKLSAQVLDRLAGRRALLIIDEANNLDLRCLEQIRSWHDEPNGPGICLLGNEELLMRIEGGMNRHQFARLNSRIGQRHIQNVPEDGDVDAFCDAWHLDDPHIRSILKKIALSPAAGGLRECHQIVENASLLAADEARPMTAQDLRDAQSMRATRNIRT